MIVFLCVWNLYLRFILTLLASVSDHSLKNLSLCDAVRGKAYGFHGKTVARCRGAPGDNSLRAVTRLV